MRGRRNILQGLILDGSEPIHPLVLEYLTRKGAIVTQQDGYAIIEGSYSLPNQVTLFAELKALSLQLYNDIIYDLDAEDGPFNTVSFKVIPKQPRDNPTPAESGIITLIAVSFFQNTGKIIKLATKDKIVISDESPKNNDLIKTELKVYVEDELKKCVNFTYTGEYKLPEVVYSPTIKNIKPITVAPMPEPVTVEAEVNQPDETKPGILSYYYNWIFGSNYKDESDSEADIDAIKTAPKP